MSRLTSSTVSSFSKLQLIAGLETLGISLNWTQKRSKADILLIVDTLNETTIRSLYDHLTASSTGSKRRRKPSQHHSVSTNEPPAKRQRTRSTSLDHEREFLDLPSREDVEKCYREFRQASSNSALKQSICVSCARELSTPHGERLALGSIPNRHHLIPKSKHFAHKLTSDLLLVSEHLTESNGTTTGWFCVECLQSLRKNCLPRLALANHMWIGPIPDAISRLTIPEQALVSLYHPRCYIYKLYPANTWAYDSDKSALQYGLRGNVTTYEHNIPDIVSMLEGGLMPRPTSILASTIAVTYIGPGQIPKNWLKRTFRVRRSAVHKALLTFKFITKHPGYRDLEISQEALNNLPEDDIPIEILAAMSSDPRLERVQEEADTYLPTEPINDILPDSTYPNEHVEGTHQGTGVNTLAEMPPNLATDKTVPDTIPIQNLGSMDTDLSKLSTEQLLLHSLVNSAKNGTGEGGYAVRHGRNAVSEFPQKPNNADHATDSPLPTRNYSVYAFPCLYPYGEGGIEAEREVDVGAGEHIRCNLQHYDRRFAQHTTWLFTWFSVLQKRQALSAARVQMRRRDFDRATQLFNTLTEHDLSAAADEETHRKPISNPVVQSLRRLMHSAGVKVMGSDASRFSYRSQIWSTSLYLNPPSLWVTINPSDLHDPIMQVMAGEDIDMDDFHATCGPNKDKRAKNLSKNPYAAAKFFHFLIGLILEKLFGISVTNRRVNSNKGVLGRVSAYYGVVEAQGRGSLHVHMLLWLKGAPSSDSMRALLKDKEFRSRVTTYVDSNMRAHLDGLNEASCQAITEDTNVAWSRPPDPDDPDFPTQVTERERRIVRALQVHRCRRTTCEVYHPSQKQWVCKRRAPFTLSNETLIHEDGQILLKRTYEYLNAWNPAITLCAACNNDIKFISNGSEARSIIWYITGYQTKKQCRAHNLSSLLAEGLAYHFASDDYIDDIRERNRLLLFRSLHVSNRQMQQSGQQIASYLMGWGDRFCSHSYVSIYWGSMEGEICRTWPKLKKSSKPPSIPAPAPSNLDLSLDNTGSNTEANDEQAETVKLDGAIVEDNTDTSETVFVETLSSGDLSFRSDVVDYRFRGPELEDYNFLSFMVDTWESRCSKSEDSDEEPSSKSTRGAPRHIRSKYMRGHPRAQSHLRVIRAEEHNVLPNIIGSWLPRNDDPDQYGYYCVSMLALLKPWRQLTDLVITDAFGNTQPWAITFGSFLLSASLQTRNIISNIQYYYQCKDSAQHDRDVYNNLEVASKHAKEDTAVEIDASIPETAVFQRPPVTEQDLEILRRDKENRPESIHGALAVKIGTLVGLLPQDLGGSWNIAPTEYRSGTNADVAKIKEWREAMTIDAQSRKHHDDQTQPSTSQMDMGNCTTLDVQSSSLESSSTFNNPRVESIQSMLEAVPAINLSRLNADQTRAFKLVERHLQASLSRRNPAQLLMQIHGEGGTGKSTVISSITELFERQGVSHQLVKAAFTGIAASLIDGSTLHSLCRLSHWRKSSFDPEISQDKLRDLREIWGNVRYLIIDEISMISRTFFAKISDVLGAVKQNETTPFGGINVLIAGDFHQFPPVACSESEALYSINNHATAAQFKETGAMITGRSIYEMFRTVVILKEQCRVTDKDWLDLLRHVRHGKCTPQHIDTLKSLIVAPRNRDAPNEEANDVVGEAWQDAVLITPRHGVRLAWNARANRRHCARNQTQLFICAAQDTINGRPLDLDQRYAMATKRSHQKDDSSQKGQLPESIELAVGLQVMVTTNVETEIDIANGSRGVIEQIIFDPRERINPATQEVQLEYLPLCVLVKLNRTKAKKLSGLEKGVIPIVPMEKKFNLPASARGKRVTRHQFPITSAYAFTDYRSQGQTIPRVIVDIAQPPTGAITPFNAYVALSRSSGKDTIRLLRDFDPEVFTKTPSERLEMEDKRLYGLDRQTVL